MTERYAVDIDMACGDCPHRVTLPATRQFPDGVPACRNSELGFTKRNGRPCPTVFIDAVRDGFVCDNWTGDEWKVAEQDGI